MNELNYYKNVEPTFRERLECRIFGHDWQTIAVPTSGASFDDDGPIGTCKNCRLKMTRKERAEYFLTRFSGPADIQSCSYSSELPEEYLRGVADEMGIRYTDT